jgi:hypothetical protein
VVAGGNPNSTIAVISQPLSYTPSSPGIETTVLLDAQGSAAKPGSTLTQFIWAIITLPGKQPVANATGRVAQVSEAVRSTARLSVSSLHVIIGAHLPYWPCGPVTCGVSQDCIDGGGLAIAAAT